MEKRKHEGKEADKAEHIHKEHIKEHIIHKEHVKHVNEKTRVDDKSDEKTGESSGLVIGLIVFIALLVLFNQYQFYSISKSLGGSTVKRLSVSSTELSGITSTAQAINMLFPLDEVKTTQDAINIMIPTGMPEYGEALGGITFDDPVNSMEYLTKWYQSLKADVQKNDPETWQRYLSLAAAPRGISCEFCCGVGAQGIDSKGNLRCGCKHNPALQALTLGLMKNTDYSDSEILKEVMRWKALWFPRNMVELTTKIAGGDAAVLKDLPGMVGGC